MTGTVSATFSGGSGGINPVDVYESSINGGATWQSYTPGTPINSAVAGANRLQIRTRRTHQGLVVSQWMEYSIMEHNIATC